MDYKYIEQLIDRYFACETSNAEERILKAFFSQSDVPTELQKYADLFCYEEEAREEVLGEDFDQRVMSRLEADGDVPELHVKVKKMTFSQRFRPLGRAAAAVAIVVLIGGSIHRAYVTNAIEPINQDGYATLNEGGAIDQVKEQTPVNAIMDNEKLATTTDSIGEASKVN